MAIEIERKFLVTGDGWRAAAHKAVPMAKNKNVPGKVISAFVQTPRRADFSSGVVR